MSINYLHKNWNTNLHVHTSKYIHITHCIVTNKKSTNAISIATEAFLVFPSHVLLVKTFVVH